ncbi:MAG TPA: POTRA domain-containing protein, partial [bacterium]|nr:POTRA domain-containing protein [bacterium]
MIDPWTRTLRALAYGVAWILLLAGATLSGLWAQPSSTQQPPSAPPAQTPAQTGPSTPPGQPPSTAPGQPAQQPSTPPAQQPSTPPGQPPIQPPAPPPAPSITPPSPFVPQPGTPPPTLPPQKVAEVVIRGNDKIPVDQILAVVSTMVADPLNEEKLRNDVQSILNLGVFQDAVVRLENVPDGVRVVFVVVENPVVDKIEVKGNTVVATDDILKALSVQTGAVLNTVTMRNGVRAVEKLYQDKG